MLYKFLIANRDKILATIREKTAGASENRPTNAASERGLPQFYDHLTRELKREAHGLRNRSQSKNGPDSTARHGQELSRLGYTVSQVVQGYGAICQAIVELAQSTRAPITAGEFMTLNLNLDVAIADAVTGFSNHANIEGVDSVKRMGALVHELRNALAAAVIAHEMITKGIVGTRGNTSALLERSLNRMRDILDRSFSEVRMRHEKPADRRPVLLLSIVDEVEATAIEEARSRGLSIKLEVDPHLTVNVDQHYMISALSNLVQNAIKYSKPGGTIRIRSREAENNVALEVEDRCGGLPSGKAEELFQPFIQKHSDRSGLGLGLTISRQAVSLNGGALSVRDLPGKGCIFTITIPREKEAHCHGQRKDFNHRR
jgi:hypothetical protein